MRVGIAETHLVSHIIIQARELGQENKSIFPVGQAVDCPRLVLKSAGRADHTHKVDITLDSTDFVDHQPSSASSVLCTKVPAHG